MTDIKTSKEAVKNFAEAWDQEVRSLWPESYPNELSNMLKDYGVKTILDCAGGTGYPSIELKQMGWDITYSDGSSVMLGIFTEKLEATQLGIPKYHSRWEELSQKVPDTYDALMCIGNSFIGINSYESVFAISDETVKANMLSAVSEFYKKLNNGGILYIDLMNANSSAPDQPYSQVLTTETDHIFTTISYDPVTNIRTNFKSKTSLIDGSVTDAVTKLVPLFTEELINLLLEAGFSRVERSTVDDADYVDSFFAFKD
ncbi:class I SAM-dependent methyltransferase [Leucothrix arctica]|uniref:Methyltransferase domain-containing protein n=1 Tax=Leucothrix arctica TaxID=1481894 RepID=A0A317CNI9_9GAMM|nr:class I SAM-dependent methyltransferase [Leucothrix arctica]PWQ97880.1 hypothetical protein DKT75_05285 [Leucothrix arctica]